MLRHIVMSCWPITNESSVCQTSLRSLRRLGLAFFVTRIVYFGRSPLAYSTTSGFITQLGYYAMPDDGSEVSDGPPMTTAHLNKLCKLAGIDAIIYWLVFDLKLRATKYSWQLYLSGGNSPGVVNYYQLGSYTSRVEHNPG